MFSLLTPVLSSPTEAIMVLSHVQDVGELYYVWEESSGEPMAIDVETNGLDSTAGGVVVGVGVADSRGALYIDLASSSPTLLDDLVAKLAEARIPMLAHNLFFEMQWLGDSLNWLGCTYAIYRHLANEGFTGQIYGLKDAQKTLLGWTETNETRLDEWLVANGYIASYSKEPKNGYYPVGGKYAAPRKEKMSLAPPDILGHYCALDADATYKLWTLVLAPTLGNFLILEKYLTTDYVEYISILVTQKLRGVLIDYDFLTEYRESLVRRGQELEAALYTRYRPIMDEYNDSIIAEKLAKEPPRYLRDKELGPEPPKHTKAGKVTSRWLNWEHERVIRSDKDYRPQTSKNWENWLGQYIEALTSEHFNFNSGEQRAWLFYSKLGYPVSVTTESGAPATGEDALVGLGEDGKALLLVIRNNKEISSIDSLLESLVKSEEGYVYHPSLKVPGTHTGRCAGAGGYNWQNPPKSPYMQSFVARPGYTLVSADIVALEAVVLAERSRDPTLLKLYGPGSTPGIDIYLFNGSQLPIIGDTIRATGFDPEAMTKEATSQAKKLCKKERSIAKTITLGANYGAGPGKLYQTLTLDGIDVTLEECKAIHTGFWQLYSGIKTWEKELVRQWRDNRGWFLNGFGRPLCLAEDYLKDIVNRDTQSTGHDAFIRFLLMTSRVLSEEGIEAWPWSADVHDALYIEVREEDADRVCSIIKDKVLSRWNEQLGGLVALKAEPAVISNLWIDKAEGDDLVAAKEFALHQRKRLCGKKE